MVEPRRRIACRVCQTQQRGLLGTTPGKYHALESMMLEHVRVNEDTPSLFLPVPLVVRWYGVN